MSRVLTFSRTFPAYHPKAGQPTYFIEKLWAGMPPFDFMDRDHEARAEKYRDLVGQHWDGYETMIKKVRSGFTTPFAPKLHTIRKGDRWKPGDKFSPRVWSGKPYCSPQIIIAPDIEVKNIWNIEFDENGVISIDGFYIDIEYEIIANNDGLSLVDFHNWFPMGKYFSGQIICWDENVNY